MKTALAIIAVVIILAGGGYAIAKHHNTNKTSTNPATTNTTSSNNMNMGGSSQSSGSSSTPSATSQVTIDNFAFSPADITVKKGTTVTWTNKDSVGHTVTENDGQTGPASSTLEPGKSYSFTYNTAGTFKYHCSIHPDMLGSVTVTQ